MKIEPTDINNTKLIAYAGGDTPSTFTLGIVDSVDAAAWLIALGISASTWTPTLTAVTNVSATTTGICHYLQIGSSVIIYGAINVTPTTSGLSTIVGISLPIPSNFGTSTDAGGMAASAGINQSGAIEGDATNDRMQMRYISADNSGRGMFFMAMYTII